MALSQGIGGIRAQPVSRETGAGERLPSSTQAELDARNTLRLVRGDLDDVQEDLEPEEEDGERQPRYLRGDFGANLVDDRPNRWGQPGFGGVADPVTEFDRRRIATELLRGIEADKETRKDWEEMASRAIKFLGLIYEEASADISTEGSVCKVWASLMLEASLGFWANAYAEFLPAGGPVKVRDDQPAAAGLGHNGGPPLDDQPDSDIDRAAAADAFELTYNHYLLVGDKQYYRDFSRMLWSLGPKGTEFRKIYYNPLRKLPVSEWVKSENLIISNEATDLSTAQRITEVLPHFTQADVKRLQYMGWWADFPLTQPHQEFSDVEKRAREVEGRSSAPPTLPADHLHTPYEVYAQRDLEGFEHEDEDGFRTGLPLPYRFTLDKDTREIVEIRRNWKEGDEDFRPRQRYVMFGLVPGFGLYYLGFSHLLANTERAATALTREMIDANMMSIFPGWLAERGALPRGTTQVRVGPMGVVELDTQMKKSVSDALQAIPVKPLDPQSLALLTKLEQNGRNVSGKLELPQGEGTQNIPVGTMIAIVEQGTKVMMAVHKGLHASRAEELELLRELIAEDPSVLSKNAKISAARREWTREEFEDLDLVPSSDPNTPSHVHRLMRGIGLAQLSQMFPQLAWGEHIYEELLRILQVQNPSYFVMPQEMRPQGGTDPAAIQAQVKQAIAQMQAQMKQAEIGSRERIEQGKSQTDLAQAQLDFKADQTKSVAQVEAARLKSQADSHDAALDRAHEVDMHNREAANQAQQDMRQQTHERGMQQDEQHIEAAQTAQQQAHERGMQQSELQTEAQKDAKQHAHERGIASLQGPRKF